MNGRPNSPPARSLILVVEDEIQLSKLFVEVLTEAGYDVVAADSVTDALSTLSYQHFDAAVLDIELRDGPVFPVADRLAALGTPFLFASAVYFQMVPKQHQGTPFVGKPFNIDELVTRVDDAVRRGRSGPPFGKAAD
ncbi:response regulator transcription factor [Stenotrophomonas rhizophila]|jgi:DNA-binding response OmpR family regulator|uniref:response regulator transcription factor n=1 Tax=Stenotrophomonas sp. BIGb0135 TaxID=2940620 RepID=UPI0021693B5B|nr:response regulator [Stenotrophomonas sp. BIGb0135]MCS4233383.1 DNA-binding response OmpR family regulator [Stenotrophomonas sp. BIGb0135]